MPRANSAAVLRALWQALTSLKFTIACLALLLVLVACCTLAQVNLGTFGAVKVYMRSFFVYANVGSWRVPVFPGGGLVGGLLLVNLAAAQAKRLEVSWRKAGLWIIHFGLILLFVGEFVTGIFQEETQMSIDEGSTANYSESPRDTEIAVIDATDDQFDLVYSVPESVFSRKSRIAHKDMPFSLVIHRYFANSSLEMGQPDPSAPKNLLGAGAGIRAVEVPPVANDNERNRVAAYVEARDGERSLGTWLLSNSLGAPQFFSLNNRNYSLAIRPIRRYLPFTLTLKDFRHDIYPGTDIPKNFSSLLRLSHPERKEDRDVLISMNDPLRYGGKAFYQASFGKEDTMTVLQVVENPGWLLPYAACILVTAGLLLHFFLRLKTA